MSQMRKDIFTGRWVIVAETDVVQPCPFGKPAHFGTSDQAA
jgi:hypothetical protein